VLQVWKVVGPVWNDMDVAWKILIGLILIGSPVAWNMRRKKGDAEGLKAYTREEKERLAVVIIICFFVIFFWMGFEQAGGTMNLFADQQTDRHLPLPWNAEWEMPAGWFQAVNPFFIIVLAPLFSMLWARNDSSRWGISTPAKMGVGMITLGLGFVVMNVGQNVAEAAGKAGIFWLMTVYFLHTVGELCLSPIGLSLVTKLSPARTVSLMMGIWFAASALADYLAGRLEEIMHYYELNLWIFLIGSSIGAGCLLLLLTPLIKKWMHDKG